MPIPAEILAVSRPKNTRVKKNGNKYDVIKRTSKIKNGKPYPVELGKIGEIIDGKYVEAKTSRLDFSKYDIKNYGRTELAYRLSKDVYKDLLEIYNVSDASKIYTIALLRSAYCGICVRDIKFKYDISYISEEIKGVSLAPSTISKFLDLLGRNYNRIKAFMDERIKKINDNTKVIVDGMLKDCNCDTSDFTKWSRKSRLKGSEDISILYAFNLDTGEPLVHKIYSGNTLDSTSFSDFIEHFGLKDCLIMGDKGFISPDSFDKINNSERNLSFLFPIKRNDKRLSKYDMFNYTEEFIIDSETILAKKSETDDGLYLYTFKSLEDESNEKKGYLKNQHKKNSFDNDKLNAKTITLGTISFISNLDFATKDIYK